MPWTFLWWAALLFAGVVAGADGKALSCPPGLVLQVLLSLLMAPVLGGGAPDPPSTERAIA